MDTKFCYTWAQADFQWNTNDFTWNDVCIAIRVGGNANITNSWIDAVDALPAKEKKRFIELVCKVKNQNGYTTEYQKRKTVKTGIKITAKDIEKTVNTILQVNLVEGPDV